LSGALEVSSLKSADQKYSYRHILVIVLLASFAVVFGCSEEEEGGGPILGNGGTGPVSVDQIILNPKSPAPGDTMRATAVVTSDGQNVSDFVSYSWTGSGGDFLENDRTTVRWVAPDTSMMFTIGVSATNSVNTSNGSTEIFTSRPITFAGKDAGEVTPNADGSTVYYLSSNRSVTAGNFNGFGITVNEMGNTTVISNPAQSFQHEFNNDLTQAVQVVGPSNGQQKLQVLDLPSGAVTDVLPQVSFNRRPQYTEPFFSPNGNLITYQAFLPDQFLPPTQGGVDTFVVYVYDVNTQAQGRVAVENTNFHPTFSTDGTRLVYVADRTASQEWELFGLAVTGDNVAVDSVDAPLQLTSTGGLMGSESEIPADQAKAWSPVEPLLAITDVDRRLRLVPIDGSGGVVASITGSVTDFVWAPDGQTLAVTDGRTISRVDKAGAATALHQAVSGDNLGRLAFTSDMQFLVFSVVRVGESWFELIDLDGSLGLQSPLRITSSVDNGETASYASLFDTRPVWLSSDLVGYFLFFDQSTPRVCKISISGLSP
jgi:hypothetical protein